jgi:hypothetical protein
MESLEIRYWRGTEKNSWTDRMKNEVLHRVMEEKNILLIIKRNKAN